MMMIMIMMMVIMIMIIWIMMMVFLTFYPHLLVVPFNRKLKVMHICGVAYSSSIFIALALVLAFTARRGNLIWYLWSEKYIHCSTAGPCIHCDHRDCRVRGEVGIIIIVDLCYYCHHSWFFSILQPRALSDYARNALLKTETGTVQCGARGLEVAIMIIVFTIVWGTGSNAISIAHDMDMLFCDNCINCDNDEGRGQ